MYNNDKVYLIKAKLEMSGDKMLYEAIALTGNPGRTACGLWSNANLCPGALVSSDRHNDLHVLNIQEINRFRSTLSDHDRSYLEEFWVTAQKVVSPSADEDEDEDYLPSGSAYVIEANRLIGDKRKPILGMEEEIVPGLYCIDSVRVELAHQNQVETIEWSSASDTNEQNRLLWLLQLSRKAQSIEDDYHVVTAEICLVGGGWGDREEDDYFYLTLDDDDEREVYLDESQIAQFFWERARYSVSLHRRSPFE